jgi:HK97 family phage major capsid protein
VIAEGMPDIAADSHPVAFGDLAAGYTFCERGALRVTIDDNVTTPGMVRWYIRRRVGGIVHDENAIRVLKCSLS